MHPVLIVDYQRHGGHSHKHDNHTNITFDASTIRLGRGVDFGPLYDDAADCGLFVRSHRTGKLAAYFLSESEGIVRDSEGDIRYWVLQPVRPSASMHHRNEVSHFDAYKNTKVTIWNT